MASKDKPIDAVATNVKVKSNTFNIAFKEAPEGVGISTESGIWSARNSTIDDGPYKGKVRHLDAWLVGKKYLVTPLDREKAVTSAEERGVTDPAQLAKIKEEAEGGFYFKWDLCDETIVVKGAKKTTQSEGQILGFINEQLNNFLSKYLPYDEDGKQLRDVVTRWEIHALGESKTGTGHTMHDFKMIPVDMMPLADYERMQTEKVFAEAIKKRPNLLTGGANGGVNSGAKQLSAPVAETVPA
jgi:hypothetical protein